MKRLALIIAVAAPAVVLAGTEGLDALFRGQASEIDA